MAIDSRKGLIACIAASLVVRVWVAVTFPALNEEAEYWGWSQHLATGYREGPPMVAWMIAAFDWLGTIHRELALRMASLICGLATLGLVHTLARRLFASAEVARLSLLLACAIPLMQASGVLMVPDAPALTFSLAAMTFFWLAVERQRPVDWLLCGAALGVATMSKLGAILILPAFIVHLATSTAHRASLRRAGPWLALIAAIAVALPFALWNADHSWATITHEIAQRSVKGFNVRPIKLLEALLEQALGTAFLLFVPLIAFLFAPLGSTPESWREPLRFLKVQSGVVFAFFFTVALVIEVHPQDLLPGYPPAVIGIAAMLVAMPKDRVWRFTRRAIAPCIALSLGIGVIAALGQGVFARLDAGRFGKALGEKIAVAQLRLYGWPDLGRQLSVRLKDYPEAGRGAFFTCRRRHAAALSFHLRGTPVIDLTAITLRARAEGAALLADRELQSLDGRDGLYFCSAREVGMGNLHEIFTDITQLDSIDVHYRGAVIGTFEVSRATGLRLKGFVPER